MNRKHTYLLYAIEEHRFWKDERELYRQGLNANALTWEHHHEAYQWLKLLRTTNGTALRRFRIVRLRGS